MAGRRVLVTGGAGFVGSHLVDALLARGDRVRILDNLDPQVHGPGRRRPAWVPADAEFIQGDMRSADDVRGSLREIDIVYHLAAAVGVGQSMYQVADYTAVNTMGTAHLLQSLVDDRGDVQKLVVASSMSIYGEGRYVRPDGREPLSTLRTPDQLRDHQWEPRDVDGTVLTPAATDEGKPLDPTSIYALTKADQEKMVLMMGAAYGIPSVALRFFNIYGPRQALSNPYTGVAAIFSARLLNGQPPLVFEDGEQKRDFVSVHDIVQALLLSAEEEAAVGKAFNVGSGRAVTVREVAQTLAGVLGTDLEAQVVDRYRVGDIRHCFADISLAREVLGYEPRVTFEEGMQELVAWLQEQERPEDHVETHAAELAARGLTL
ncbi:MAG TPA: NAD-dependent epimerase/dehydratase family protein [Longimicrobium sp.]|uniref:NAD-dependent epimerase/dehydratase family protein n=1 Tax=Longimicrobium sp. TaxID=2029185 RepID=UPI002ED7F41E